MTKNLTTIEQSHRWQCPCTLLRSPPLPTHEISWNSSSQEYENLHHFDGLLPHRLKPVIDYVNAALDQSLEIEELAAIAQLSQHHFSRAFKRTMGMSPHQYVIQQRVEQAKQLLRERKMSICEVAIACGFTHQSHLNRHFKRLTGVTPKAFSKL